MAADTEITRLDLVEKDKIEAILNAQTLPNTTSTDNGKVLQVKSGKWSKSAIDTLPAVTASDNGKVLMVVDGAWAVAALPSDETTEG